MYIYNVTTNVDPSIHDNWIVWMREIHIPEMLSLGKFSNARMSKVLIEEEMGGITYSVQYITDSLETLQQYYNEDAPRLREDGIKRFGNKIVAFRTELEIISDH